MDFFKTFIYELKMWFINYIVTWIPCWAIRRMFYKLAGLTIGRESRILMGTWIYGPEKITIGQGTVINERCVLDGGESITIADNVSISRGTMIYSATHDSSSDKFAYITAPVIIEDNVWTGIGSIILPGATLKYACILAAGSVAKKGVYSELGIYSGVPAKKIGERKLDKPYSIRWKPYFR